MDQQVNAGTSGEKREYPRAMMSTPARFRLLGPHDAEKALNRHFDPDELLTEYKEGETLDVSKTGVMLLTNEDLKLGSFIAASMHLSVPGISCNCKVLGEVVRRHLNENGKYKYKVGLKLHRILHQNLKTYKYLDFKDLLSIKERQI